jgi:hypothetical protein
MPDGERGENPAGEQVAEGAQAPAAAPAPAIEVPTDLDVDELLAQGALEEAEAEAAAESSATSEDAPAGDDEPEPDDEPEDDDEDLEDEPVEADLESDEDDEPSEDEVTFERLVDEGRSGEALLTAPQRWSNIPTASRAEAIKASQDLAYKVGAQDASRALGERQQADQQLREYVAEKNILRENDERGFVDWQDEKPEEAARYFEARRYLAALANGETAQPPAQVVEPETAAAATAVQQGANLQIAKLQELPQSVADPLRERIRAQEFPLTEAGLGALTEAVKRASLETPSSNGNGKTGRKARARRRNGTARPAVDSGASNDKSNPLSDINDVETLLEMAAAES